MFGGKLHWISAITQNKVHGGVHRRGNFSRIIHCWNMDPCGVVGPLNFIGIVELPYSEKNNLQWQKGLGSLLVLLFEAIFNITPVYQTLDLLWHHQRALNSDITMKESHPYKFPYRLKLTNSHCGLIRSTPFEYNTGILSFANISISAHLITFTLKQFALDGLV